MNIVNLKWQKSTTDLGVPLHTYNMPHANSVLFGVAVNVGSRDENWPNEAGMAHALEHMIFQGAGKFSDTEAIGAYIKRVGGYLNAYTNKEQTFFFCCVPAEHIERAIHLVSRQIIQPLLPEEKIETEMQNIVQEIRGKFDDPETRIVHLCMKSLYGQHPLGKEVLGTEESVSKFTKTDFVGFHNRFYKPNNLNIIVVGKISNEDTLLLLNRYFSDIKASDDINMRHPALFTTGNKPFVIENRDIHQLHLTLAVTTCPGESRHFNILDVFETMISTGMSAPLFIEVRNKLGLCYTISASNISESDLGSFVIYTATDEKLYKKALEAIFRVIEENRYNNDLLSEAKEFLKGRLLIKHDGLSSIFMDAANAIRIFKRPLSKEELLKTVENVSINDIGRVVDLYLNPSRISHCYIVPQGVTITP